MNNSNNNNECQDARPKNISIPDLHTKLASPYTNPMLPSIIKPDMPIMPHRYAPIPL